MTTEFDTAFATLCANDRDGPVALTLQQALMPVEGHHSVIFPPSYPRSEKDPTGKRSRYNIDTLGDGSTIVTIDSVASQANQMEPVFMRRHGEENPLADLVPQIDVTHGNDRVASILTFAHRLADATLRGTELDREIQTIFLTIKDADDYTALVKMAPTSALFGCWDSRASGVKIPRIIQSVIRATDAHEIERSSVYNPTISAREEGIVTDEEAVRHKNDLSGRGYSTVPSVGEELGGVIVHGEIIRSTTINLVALRRLRGEKGEAMRRYLLGLAVVAATTPSNLFLRQGCLLTLDPDRTASWEVVMHNGQREALDLNAGNAVEVARAAAAEWGVGPSRSVAYERARARRDIGLPADEAA